MAHQAIGQPGSHGHVASMLTAHDSRDPQGRDASSPWSMPLAAWKEVALRTWKEASADSIGLVAAGVGFYAFLALVPLLGAVVLTYGLLAAPETVVRNMNALTTMLPAEVAKLIGEQLMNVVQTSGGKKGLGVAVALGVALFGARNAAGGIIQALNIAYEEDEKRGFIKVTLLALTMTVAAVVVFVVALLAVAATGYLHKLMPQTNTVILLLLRVLSYLVLAGAAATAAAVLYRYGPSRDKAKWAWLTPGSVLFAVGWGALTLGFGIYVANFGNYGATYGSLSAVVVLLTWLYLSSYILLFGAELNSELEHQTARDTTRGAERPLGERHAWAADHVARGANDAGEARDSAGAELGDAAAKASSAMDEESNPVGGTSENPQIHPKASRAERRQDIGQALAQLDERSGNAATSEKMS